MTLATVAFSVNGRQVSLEVDPRERLSETLRHRLGLTGTKVGCNAGDCGACTVLVEGEQLCACLLPCGQLPGKAVTTVEGLSELPRMAALQQEFLEHGAAQCGICTPGMLMAAAALLKKNPQPDKVQVQDALGGVLCRCTGYQKIVEAVCSLGQPQQAVVPPAGAAVGARMVKTDGAAKINGAELYGADTAPEDALWLRVIRSPHARATFSLGDLPKLVADTPGLAAVLSAADVPGNAFGVYPTLKDQPVLADGVVRYRGEAVLALVGERAAIWALAEEALPITWQVEDALDDCWVADAVDGRQVHAQHPDNVLARGHVDKGDAEAALATAEVVAEGSFATPFIEHAYIEPEAGYALRRGDRLEIWATTQAPYMDRDETALVLGLDKEQVRIIPSACGGGFGGKLDLSIQPLVGLAAWRLDRPVRGEYSRPESMMSSTKRHPSRITARLGCRRDGKLTALRFHGIFDTGAYASWGPTVSDRVPVHCSGPYVIPHVLADTEARFTNAPPSGAFRGFGVPQAALANEGLMDDLAEQIGMDPLEFRYLNAIRAGQATATGQVLQASVGLDKCIEALRPDWQALRQAAEEFNAESGRLRRGVGIGCVWYGCGNTSMSNPSTLSLGIDRQGKITLYNGAVDIGQGSNTVMAQIAADGLGLPADLIHVVMGDTALTADAGKTSASRQTFISGKAAELAGRDLRQKILRLANAGKAATLELSGSRILVSDDVDVRTIELAHLPLGENGDVVRGSGTFDPPSTALDEHGQGDPYATYGFAAQIAEVEVDVELGTVKVLRLIAAHDVGRAVNPTLVEGQIHGGIAQGLGLALMEEYLPGRTENLHDYLIPTIGDMPEIKSILIEDPEPLGPYGAKGVGEHSLIATAPAIFGGVYQATAVRLRETPATPDRVRAALRAAGF
ncbi:molybdopterin-dependent oxidoreductase [Pelagibius litoralis]|uniref:Molybdopterin-dependent oxidoreductase n=1 Tax=Pelagibius litoralis TaxID=374515 RepID=A0A967EZ39_9PROT|nr:molybdopterin cofactor-binding domain-containing protein [Pelagibius litoralis]NIA70010.1 molybdopterin-dependent oxidoreductase [Pelagibius litoralis]